MALEGSREGEGEAALQYGIAVYLTSPVNKADFLKFSTGNPWSDGI
jgi:hypothetical protein